MRLLSFLRGVTIKLQKRSIDILSAYKQVQTVQTELESFNSLRSLLRMRAHTA